MSTHPLNLTFVPPVRSFHPTLHFHLAPAPSPSCTAHIELSLPDSVFPDRNELSDKWSGSSVRAWYLFPEEIDIERPVGGSGSALRLELDGNDGREIGVEVPLHARYLSPTEKGEEEVMLFGQEAGQVRGVWLCGAVETTDHLPIVKVEPLSITLPTGRPSHQLPVELATAAAIWLGWIYLVRKILKLARRPFKTSKPKSS